MNELYEQIHEQVAREARLAAAKWNGMAEADDVEQDLWVWILESPSIQKYLRDGEPAQTSKALSTKANSICSQERLSADHFSGNWNYNPGDVRDLLDTYWGTDVQHVSPEVMAMAEAELSPTMIQNILGGTISADEMIDLGVGLANLEDEHPTYFEAVSNQFRLGLPIKDRAEQDRRERAVDKLTTLMNRKRSQREMDRTEGPGTKPKITNPDY